MSKSGWLNDWENDKEDDDIFTIERPAIVINEPLPAPIMCSVRKTALNALKDDLNDLLTMLNED
jgi:hypothetical protein